MTDIFLTMPPTQAMTVCGLMPIAAFAALYLTIEAARTVALALGLSTDEVL